MAENSKHLNDTHSWEFGLKTIEVSLSILPHFLNKIHLASYLLLSLLTCICIKTVVCLNYNKALLICVTDS